MALRNAAEQPTHSTHGSKATVRLYRTTQQNWNANQYSTQKRKLNRFLNCISFPLFANPEYRQEKPVHPFSFS